MKLHPDDPRLSSYLLGELPPDEAAEVERAAAADPALGLALGDLARFHRRLGAALGGEALQLHPWQRGAVLRAAADAAAAGRVVELPSRRRSWRPVLAVAAAVAAAAGVIWMMWSLPGRVRGGGGAVAGGPRVPDWSNPAVEVALLPLPGPPGGVAVPTGVASSGRVAELAAAQEAALDHDPGGFLRRSAQVLDGAPAPPETYLPVLPERPPRDAAAAPVLGLPLIAGDLSFGWLRAAVLEAGKLPSRAAVRIEELVNHGRYRFGRSASAAGVLVSTESLRCPWDETSALTLVAVECEAGEARRVAAEVDFDPARIARYRLLGFERGRAAAGEGTLLPGGHAVTLAIQSWPTAAAGAGDLGLEVAADVATADGPVPVRVSGGQIQEWDEAGDAARHAALMAGLGMALRGSTVAAAPALTELAVLAAAETDRIAQTAAPERLEPLRLIETAARLK